MNAPVNPQKPMVSIATDTNKRMGFNNFVKDIQGTMPIQPMMAPQMPPPMPQQAMVPQVPAMPASSQSIRGGIGMPMPPVQGFDNGGAAGLSNVEKILIRDHGFSLNPEGQVVSPAGQIRTVVDGKTTFSAPPTFDQQFAAQQASAIDATNQDRMNQAIASGSNTYQSMATDGSGVITDTSIPNNLSDIEQLKLDSGLTNIYDTEGNFVSSSAPAANQVTASNNPNNEEFINAVGDIFQPGGGLPSSLTPIQQAALALQDKIDEVGVSTFSRESDDDRAIRLADGTPLLDQDILDQYGVGRKEFLNAIDDLGVGRSNLFRTSGRGSNANAFQTGLENILLSPEERIIAEQEYADAQAAKKKDDRDAFYGKDADSTGKITSGKNKGKFSQSYIDHQARLDDPTRTGDFLTDLQTAGTDLASRPGMLMDDLSKLGSSVSQGFSDLTSGISDLFTGGRDDTPSAPPTQFSDANLNAMSDALGMEAFDALSGDERVTPFSDPMYGEQGRGFFPPDTEITQSNLPPAGTAYDAGEFVGVGPRLEYMDDDEGFDSAVYVPPSVATNLGISIGDSGVDSGLPNISGLGDAPVIGGVPQLGTLQNFDFTNQLQDRDMAGLGDDQVDLSGLPANIQGLPPSDLQAQRELDVLRGSQAPDPEMDALSLLQQFRDAQPEGALKGGAFDFVPDPQQLQNFAQDSNLSSSLDNILRNIDFTSYIPPASQGDVQPKPLEALRNLIGPAGASTIDGFRNESTRGPDSRNIFTDMDGNPNVINPDGSITNITTGQTDYSGLNLSRLYSDLDLSGLPKTIGRGSIDRTPADVAGYGKGLARVSGSGVDRREISSPKSVSDLLDDIRTGEVTTTFYKDETIGRVLPTNVEHGYGGGIEVKISDADGVELPSSDLRTAAFRITNPDGSVDIIRSDTNRNAYIDFMNGLAQIDLPAGSTIVDNPKTEGTYQRSPDDKTSLQFFDDTQTPSSISVDVSNLINKGVDSPYTYSPQDLTNIMGGSGGFGGDMAPGTQSNLLGDLSGFEQRFDSEIADLNNQSQLTDLTNLLNESGSSISDADIDSVQGLDILSSEFSDSDQDASSGDVLADVLNTGTNVVGDATSGTAGGGSEGGQSVSDADVDLIGDAIGEIVGGDATGAGTGSGDGIGDGTGTGDGSGSGTGGTTTGGEGDGEGGGGGDVINIPPSGGDSDGSKQERRDYSRIREILEQRPRRIGGTAPGLGYKPVEGISNTLNKAADSFLDALRFG